MRNCWNISWQTFGERIFGSRREVFCSPLTDFLANSTPNSLGSKFINFSILFPAEWELSLVRCKNWNGKGPGRVESVELQWVLGDLDVSAGDFDILSFKVFGNL